ALLDPALGAVDIADAMPMVEFGDDLDGHALAREDPVDRILLARSGADIDLVRAQGDEARLREVLLGGAPGNRRQEDGEDDRQGQRRPPRARRENVLGGREGVWHDSV